jgi:glycosyltransferase involved in cell wall biosynthesis
VKILTSSHYIADFTVPSQSEHIVKRVRFPELGRLWGPAMAIAVCSPGTRYDLAHFINKIPINLRKPWVITFESALPRMFPPREPLRQLLRDQLCRPNCLAIIAMSSWALNNFGRINEGWEGLHNALGKTHVLHPAIAVGQSNPQKLRAGEPIQIIFVGNCFARKGGIVALRLAKKALAERVPLHINIVSSQMIYSGTHTDHPDAARYAADLKNMDLPNVTFHGAMNNKQVLDIMSRCHVNLLATLYDTYGFSVLEGFANGLPAITSDVCALPEFVFPQRGLSSNGFLLNLPKSEDGRWSHADDSGSPDYWDMLDQAFESMTNQAFGHLQELAAAPERLEQLSRGARAGVEERHNPARLAAALDAMYNHRRQRTSSVISVPIETSHGHD